jgi:Raf kinase inhibitor-like YbhB/YbcL family protein
MWLLRVPLVIISVISSNLTLFPGWIGAFHSDAMNRSQVWISIEPQGVEPGPNPVALTLTAPLSPAESFHAHSMKSEGGSKMSLNMESSAFKNGAEIPRKFTCEGADVSPPLKWDTPPSATKSLALIADDPDAPGGTWVHWVMYNLEPQLRELQEGIAQFEEVPGIGRQGLNDFRKIGYGGPCPPPGKPHRYFFKLYALDTKLNLKARATKRDVEQAMKGHVLAQAELVGKYKR